MTATGLSTIMSYEVTITYRTGNNLLSRGLRNPFQLRNIFYDYIIITHMSGCPTSIEESSVFLNYFFRIPDFNTSRTERSRNPSGSKWITTTITSLCVWAFTRKSFLTGKTYLTTVFNVIRKVATSTSVDVRTSTDLTSKSFVS